MASIAETVAKTFILYGLSFSFHSFNLRRIHVVLVVELPVDAGSFEL